MTRVEIAALVYFFAPAVIVVMTLGPIRAWDCIRDRDVNRRIHRFIEQEKQTPGTFAWCEAQYRLQSRDLVR